MLTFISLPYFNSGNSYSPVTEVWASLLLLAYVINPALPAH